MQVRFLISELRVNLNKDIGVNAVEKFVNDDWIWAQMHLYIEPLNGSIDVTSFFRRMQYTTQKIAFLF